VVKKLLRKQKQKAFLFRGRHQLKDFVAKIAVFENRIAEYFRVFEKRKRRKGLFAGPKTRIDDTP